MATTAANQTYNRILLNVATNKDNGKHGIYGCFQWAHKIYLPNDAGVSNFAGLKSDPMRIVIAGAGEVGFHLAKLLSYESQDILLIDRESQRLEYAETHFDVMTVKGNVTSLNTLREAGVSKAGLFIAVTSFEETNITAAILAKQLGAPRTIARISNNEFLMPNEVDFEGLGIDNMISPEELAAREIERLIKQFAFTDTFDFDGGLLRLVGVHLEGEAPIAGKTIIEVAQAYPELQFMPVCIRRNNQTIIPRGDSSFQLEDYAYFIINPASIDLFYTLVGKKKVGIKNIMILGGSQIGYKAARMLCPGHSVKIIESDTTKCEDLAEALPRTLVIEGDGRNVELLEEEGIDGMDAFIAVTGNSETNIMSCLVAKAHGVKKTIALVENMEYIHVSQTIGIDCMINKKLIAASNIFRYVRQGGVVSLANLHGVEAEVLEFEVNPGSKVTRHPIRKLKIPRSAVIGGVIRNRKGMIVLGDFQIQNGDRVVVFCLPEAIHKVEMLFS